MTAAAVLTAYVLPATALAAGFANGSFESGSAPGGFLTVPAGGVAIDSWSVDAGSVDYIGTYWKASDGDRSIDMSGNTAGTISQSFDTVPGTTYEVTFDLSGNPAGGPDTKTLRVSADAASAPVSDYDYDTSAHGTSLGDMKWESETYEFTASAASTKLTFESLTDGYYGPALDNVVIAAVTTGEILTPTAGEAVSGSTDFTAVYHDGEDPNPDGVQWAVRMGTCAAGVGTVFGNVDGHSDAFSWDGMNFSATADTSLWTPGSYCFVFNPIDDPGQPNIRLTREFVVEAPFVVPTDKNECKKGGWMDLTDANGVPFKNQGDCVSYVATGGKNEAAGK